jgi:hypothetical protein
MGSSHTFRCSTVSIRPGASSPALTSPLTRRPVCLSAPQENSLEAAAWYARTALYPIGRAPRIAEPAHSSRVAPKGAKRIVTRNLFEAEREHVRALKGTEAFERSARERRKVEMSFAHLKRNLGFRRLRLRGITGAADEFLLAATVQNLKKLARFMAYHPPISAGYPA